MPFQLTTIDNPVGFNSDLSPYTLPPNVFTTSHNTTTTLGRTAKAAGATSIYGGSLAEPPLFILPWNDGTEDLWIYASTGEIRTLQSDETEAVLTSTPSTSLLEGWTGDVFNGVAIMNANNAAPLYTDTASSMAALVNWPSASTPALAGVVRPFKNYLIALDYTTDEATPVRYPSLVKWSSPADIGSVPSSWDESSAEEQAGEYELSDTPGDCIDGRALGDTFVVYKQDAVWGMNIVGGQYVFQFRKLFNDSDGILARDCVVEFEGKHFVLARGDAYVHDGNSKGSVMSSQVKSTLFGTLDEIYWAKTRVVADNANKNIWIYYIPTGTYDVTGATAPFPLATKALIWNWESGTWSSRDIAGVSYITSGFVADTETDDWQADLTGSWEDDTSLWDEGASTPDQPALVACDYENDQLLELETGTTWDGTSQTTTIERVGLDFGDASVWKKVKAIYPSMSGAGTVDISVGHEERPNGGITYEGPYSFEIGVDNKIDCRVAGRNIALKIESTSDPLWTLDSIGVEWKPSKARR